MTTYATWISWSLFTILQGYGLWVASFPNGRVVFDVQKHTEPVWAPAKELFPSCPAFALVKYLSLKPSASTACVFFGAAPSITLSAALDTLSTMHVDGRRPKYTFLSKLWCPAMTNAALALQPIPGKPTWKLTGFYFALVHGTVGFLLLLLFFNEAPAWSGREQALPSILSKVLSWPPAPFFVFLPCLLL